MTPDENARRYDGDLSDIWTAEKVRIESNRRVLVRAAIIAGMLLIAAIIASRAIAHHAALTCGAC